MVHVHNVVLFSYLKKKECIWVSSIEVYQIGAYYTKWSKSERETPIQNINAYVWNLERQLWWSYMQDSKRDTDEKNKTFGLCGRRQGWNDLKE